jgi:formate-dependent nitrite reductase membrane component NrfD
VTLQELPNLILVFLQIAVVVATVYSFVHAAMQRTDAYTAAGKLTKPAWLGILGVSVVLTVLLQILGVVIAACASGVYLVDVRPKILEIQGKSR